MDNQVQTEQNNFKVNLGGLLDLFSRHLYSGPQVFVRELLQNSVDAIRARQILEPGFEGKVEIELSPASEDAPASLIFEDDGIGLNPEEVHTFLSTIGSSSKRADDLSSRDTYIGQFGVGMLSAFMASDRIVLITRSARDKGNALQWESSSEGTYSLKELSSDFRPGTKVFLSAKKGMEDYFEPSVLENLLRHYGSFISMPVFFRCGNREVRINENLPPWKYYVPNEETLRTLLLDWAKKELNEEFMDAFPIKSATGKADGVGFILGRNSTGTHSQSHRLYLKGMLINDYIEKLLPDWAFFVKVVVDSSALRPTASREDIFKDEILQATREELGASIRAYLIRVAGQRPEILTEILSHHHLAIKGLALRDEECFKLFIDLLPFETNLGMMTLGDFRRRYGLIRYIPDLDQFRQVKNIATAQGLCIINAGYIYEAELLKKIKDYYPSVKVSAMSAMDLTKELDDLEAEEKDASETALKWINEVMHPFLVRVEVKKFLPKEVSAMIGMNKDMDFLRMANQSKEVSSPLWGGILNSLTESVASDAKILLTMNFNNSLVMRLIGSGNKEVQKRATEVLYVQALMLGHYPLDSKELDLLNQGMTAFLEWGLEK